MTLEFANRLTELRKQNGYSQEELADKIGVSRQSISKWERGESSPDTDNLIELAKLYNMSLDDLVKLNINKDIKEEKPLDNKENGKIVLENDQIQIEDDDSKVVLNPNGIYISKGGKIVKKLNDDEDPEKYDKRGHIILEALTSIFTILLIIAYIVLGLTIGYWHPGWMFFLLVPVIPSFVKAIMYKNGNHFLYPLLVTFLYLFLSYLLGLWHILWVLFISIPLYYSAVNLIRGFKRKK